MICIIPPSFPCCFNEEVGWCFGTFLEKSSLQNTIHYNSWSFFWLLLKAFLLPRLKSAYRGDYGGDKMYIKIVQHFVHHLIYA